MKLQVLLVLVCVTTKVLCLNNGLALTPPMGWLAWQRYRCLTDCKTYPDECVSENLIKRQAKAMVDQGFLKAGYEYIILDDCWLADKRDSQGKLQPDKTRFPGGMKSLGDYVHNLGLKFGIYNDFGTKTCAGFPGSIDDLKLDAETFAEWGVDYLKTDTCYTDDRTNGYFETSDLLNQTGRPILYSCCMVNGKGLAGQYELAQEYCNQWRVNHDIDDSFDSMKSISTWVGENQDSFADKAGPGHWNDPDMLLVGGYGLSLEQSRHQMALWSIMAAPLLMSNDLTSLRQEDKDILLNKEAIRINQDSLGKQGRRVAVNNDIHVWTKQLFGGDWAIALASYRSDGYVFWFPFKLSDFIGASNSHYRITDVFEEDSAIDGQLVSAEDPIGVRIKPSGVSFLRLSASSFVN